MTIDMSGVIPEEVPGRYAIICRGMKGNRAPAGRKTLPSQGSRRGGNGGRGGYSVHGYEYKCCNPGRNAGWMSKYVWW